MLIDYKNSPGPTSDLLFLSLSLQQTLISVVLETPQFILQLLSFVLWCVELILHLLSELVQSGLVLHQQAVPNNFLWSKAAKSTYMD